MRTKALMVACVVAATMVVPVSTAAALDDINTKKLRNAVTVAGIMTHERVLQRIANRNDGTRASGTSGYEASAQYVKLRLKMAGYKVTEQVFEFPFFQELAPATFAQITPTPATYVPDTMEYSGSGDVIGPLVPTNDIVIPPTPTPSSSSGCEASDFVPASAALPAVALVQRGTCDFAVKAQNAQDAGYAAIAIFNEGQPGREGSLAGTLGAPSSMPTVGIDFATGAELYEATQAGPVEVHLTTSTFSETRLTKNVIADSRKGNPNKVIVVGAHLDSVIEGPGINDNGSGTAVILETAIQMAKLKIAPRQQVRFAFWGAEESGLLGSTYYVDNLSDAKLGKIYANLNFDMLGSPNYVRFVYDGDSEGTPPGSAQIETLFNDYFAKQGLATEPTAFDGRSDYGPFIDVGIPAGGLFTGAEVVKTPEQAEIFGGTAGVPYDVCYHEACDTINNLSTKALFEMGDAAAHAIATLALSRDGFFEDGSRIAARQANAPMTFEYKGNHLLR